MKRLVPVVLTLFAVMPVFLASCNSASNVGIPAARQPVGDIAEMTNTPEGPPATGTFSVPTATEDIAPFDIPAATGTFSVPTATEDIATPTPPIPASPPPDIFTTELRINLPTLSGSFVVPARTNLTLRDIGSDGQANTCTISKDGSTMQIIRTVPRVGSSKPFQLTSGEYTLNCRWPGRNATISSRSR